VTDQGQEGLAAFEGVSIVQIKEVKGPLTDVMYVMITQHYKIRIIFSPELKSRKQ